MRCCEAAPRGFWAYCSGAGGGRPRFGAALQKIMNLRRHRCMWAGSVPCRHCGTLRGKRRCTDAAERRWPARGPRRRGQRMPPTATRSGPALTLLAQRGQAGQRLPVSGNTTVSWSMPAASASAVAVDCPGCRQFDRQAHRASASPRPAGVWSRSVATAANARTQHRQASGLNRRWWARALRFRLT